MEVKTEPAGRLCDILNEARTKPDGDSSRKVWANVFGGCGAFLTAYFIMIARLNGRADRVDKKIKAHLNQLANWAYENKAKYMENT